MFAVWVPNAEGFFYISTTPSNFDVIFVFPGVNFVDSIVIHLNSDLEFLTYSTKYEAKLLEAVEKGFKRRKWAENWHGISRWTPTYMV